MKVGVGIVTYQRPEFFRRCAESVVKHLSDVADVMLAYHDGPMTERYGFVPIDIVYTVGSVNQGVGAAKNVLLRSLTRDACDVLFLAEDDIEILSPLAVTGYLDAMAESGLEHLSFHAHGPANRGHMPTVDGLVSYWPACVGAWTSYTAHALEVGGLMDEHFVNAWDHVEHTMRLASLGLTSQFPQFADATGSEHWLREQACSEENSVIRPREDWQANIARGREHWRRRHPETYRLLWGAS